MIITGLIKRLIHQLPINVAGQKTNSRTRDIGTLVTNYVLLMKKRLSIKDSFKRTLGVDSSPVDGAIDTISGLLVDHMMDFDAHCEHEENEVEVRKEEQA